MSNFEKKAIEVFLSDLKHARQVKRAIIRLAQEEPERVLRAIESLPGQDQKFLRWVKSIAEKFLSQ